MSARLRRFVPSTATFVVLGLLLAACGDDDNGPGPDAAVDADTADASAVDGGDEVITEPLVPERWLGAATSTGTDLVYEAVRDGTFALPAPDDTYLGVQWFELATGDNSSIGPQGMGEFWIAAHVQVPAGRRVYARADSIRRVYSNNRALQPGELYHTRRRLVPLDASGEEATLGTPGLNLVVSFGDPNPGRYAELELWSTNAEAVFNTKDVTAPSLVTNQDDELPLGIHVLHLGESAALDVVAHVVEDATFAARSRPVDTLPPDAVTQVTFLLQPRQPVDPAAAGGVTPVTLRLESPSWQRAYETTVEVAVVAEGERYRQTRVSGVDGSTQYHAVLPPVGWPPSPMQDFGLILSLHGAGVQAWGQAGSYAPKDWAFLVAATNRRPFGFDWEEWGRLDALEALDYSLDNLPIDETRVHLTGHSMGGHGSWHVGVHHGGRFGLIAPSAGWISFDLYSGPPAPTGMVGRARAHSQTLDFVDNLKTNGVYIIHGDADNNVPVSHAQQMYATLQPIVTDLWYHEEPGAGHWWDRDIDPAAGVDCVDWTPAMEEMRLRNREVTPLSFHFSSSSPWVSSRRSFLRVLSTDTPLANFTVDATGDATSAHVDVVTDNVRSLEIDLDALAAAGVSTYTVDNTPHSVSGTGVVTHGAATGKHPDQHGPLNQVFHRPFCFVYDAAGPAAYRHYAAYLLSYWSILGNGHGCAVSLDDLTPALAAERNLIYLGVAMADLPDPSGLPITWDDTTITAGGSTFNDAALAYVYPDGDKMAAYFYATPGREKDLFIYMPFTSRSGLPDFFVLRDNSLVALGFFDSDWQLDPAFADGL